MSLPINAMLEIGGEIMGGHKKINHAWLKERTLTNVVAVLRKGEREGGGKQKPHQCATPTCQRTKSVAEAHQKRVTGAKRKGKGIPPRPWSLQRNFPPNAEEM